MDKCVFRWYLSNSRLQEYLWHLFIDYWIPYIHLIARGTSFSISRVPVLDVTISVLVAVISDSESNVEGTKEKQTPENSKPQGSELADEVFLEWLT